jgi:hypothetical protein
VREPRMGDDMEANEAAELMEQDKQENRFKQRAAILIAVLAMVLAITSLGGNNAGKEAVNNNILASNFFNFYQAKNMRQTALMLAADEFEIAWSSDPGLSADAKAALAKKLGDYKKTIGRYESDPDTQEGKKELMARARAYEEARDHALRQDPYFDYAETLLQIAIVLISVAIVADAVWLSFIGAALGVIGTLLMIDGYTLLVAIPGLG